MAQWADIAGDARAKLRGRSIWNVLPVMALVVFGTIFVRHISSLDPTQIWAALTALAPWQWMAALVFTALSLRAIGTYDVLVHRVLNTGQPTRAARSAGVKAIALSQTLGFGALTSALVRWRCLPGLPAGAILRLSAIVSVSSLAALAAVAALVVPTSGLLGPSSALVWGGVAAIAALAVLARLAHRLRWIPAPVRAGTMIALLIATAADTGFAAAALWALWPDAMSFHVLFAAYLVALGAGLMSNAPGGVGAFDLTLLALLPIADDAAAMAALLAFRVIYYALPATLALIGLLRPAPTRTSAPVHHPEAALRFQNATAFHHPKSTLLTLPCWGAGALLGDLPDEMALCDLHGAAPKALYKCSARQARDARRAGWTVLRCAQDAVIDVQNWTLDGPDRRQLRRALKGFAASGLTIKSVTDPASLADIATAWVQSHRRERGVSMGRFCPEYLRHQQVFAAFDGARPVAFISFHIGAVWTLDLMRNIDNLPTGTMQALVCAGIDAARADEATKLNLSAVHAPAAHLPLAARALRRTSGLRRFKSAFGPTWQPRYICATTPVTLALTMITLAYNIYRPPALHTYFVQPDDEDYSFAPPPRPCEPIPSHAGAYAHDKRPLRPPRHA